jgi:hypothetical protein
MKLKPSAFKDNKILDKEFENSFVSSDDKLYLED